MAVDRLVLFYDSDHGVVGDMAYVFRKVFKGESCSLCSITHKGVRERAEWRQCQQRMGVPVSVLYRDQATAEHRAAAGGEFPCALVERDGRYERVLGRAELDACGGSVEALESALRERGVG